jgi:putative hemolysin
MEINIRKVFREKNKKLANLLPGFVFSYIEKIIHQKEANFILKEYGHLQGIDFLEASLRYFNITVDINGLENIPVNGRYLFVSNHPLGGFDGLVLIKILGHKFGPIKVMVNDILMNIKNLECFFLPINKHGNQNKQAVLLIDQTFASEIPILTFPAGLCSRKIKGEIVDLEWKKNFVSKAISSKRNIVPIYFEGQNSNFFYNLSNFRKKIGIKANIEMIYLVDELFKHKNKSFSITIGNVIGIEQFEKNKNHAQIALAVKEHVYNLSKNPNSVFVYKV